MNSTLRIRQTVAAVAMGLSALATARGAEALSLGVAPSASIVAPGDPLSVDAVISGLGDGAAPSLGVFDLDVVFDPAVVGVSGVTFGLFLGDAAAGEALVDAILGGGVVDLFALSLLSAAELDALHTPSSGRTGSRPSW